MVEEPALGEGGGVCVCLPTHMGRCEEVGGPWFLVVLGGFPVVRMPRPLPGAWVWSWVRELGSYM